MLEILRNNIRRDLYRNRITYLLMGLLIAVGMYIASSLAAITYSYNLVCEKNYIDSNYQDGQFSLKKPLTDSEESFLEKQGYGLERIFSFDLKQEDGSILRIFKNRQKIDLLVLDKGHHPKQLQELVLDKCYASSNGIAVGDSIQLGSQSYQVCGIGSVTDYDMPSRGLSDYSSDSESFGLVFLTDQGYEALLSQIGDGTRQEYVYSYKLPEGGTDDDLREKIQASFGANANVLTFVPRANNERMCSAVADGFAYEIAGFIIGIGLLVLVSVVFYLGIKSAIEKESASIGSLYAMGVKKTYVIIMYLAPPTLIAFVAGSLGWLAGIWFSAAELISNSDYYCIPYVPIRTSPLIFVYCVLVPPIVCFLINFFRLNRVFSMAPVALLKGTINNDVRQYRSRGKGRSILCDLIFSRFLKDIGLFAVLLIGSLVSGMIYMLGIGIGQFVNNIEEKLPQEINYEYVYDLMEDSDAPVKTGEAVYKKVFKIGDEEYMSDIQFIGLEPTGQFFHVDTKDLNGKVLISSAVASHYDLEENDEFTVYDDLTGKAYTFSVAGIADYDVMLTAYMDIDDLRELLGKGKVYNSIYANEVCDYAPSELRGSYKRIDYLKPVESFNLESGRMRIFLITVSLLFYMAMVIFIVRFSVNGGMHHIAIHSVLGYSNRELQLIFLSSTAVFTVLCGIVGLLTGFGFSGIVVRYLMNTTPIGIHLKYPVVSFIRDVAVVIFVYLIAAFGPSRQIKTINELDLVRANE
ncbi:MAG: FtsX-like permease family protein [Lachnospiraceae bacterium]|nr:FtsX-like permease family protein [Lachnospiraceae bacterium]